MDCSDMNKRKIIRIIILIVAVALSFSMASILGNDYWVSILIMIALNILLTSSLRTIYILDEVSLGQVGFTLIGAYTSALLTLKLGLPFWTAMIIAGLFSALIAFLLGYPFLRLKGIYFSILTFMTAEILRLITYNWRDLTGGQYGLSKIPAPASISLPMVGEISFDSMTNYYYLTLVIVIISLYFLYCLEHSHLNRKWRAIRDADNLALSVGINIMWYKVINFTIASFFAGIAGSLFAHYQGGLSVDVTSRFGVMMSLYLVLLMVIGGKERFTGPIIGAIGVEMLSEFSRPLDEYRPMLIGALAIVVMLIIPQGIVGIPSLIRGWIGKRKSSKVF
jgi:branched-chain amino acid transport system permease protein